MFMHRRSFLLGTLGTVSLLAGCSSGNNIVQFQMSTNTGKTRERELEAGQRLELAVRRIDESTTVTGTVTRMSTGEVIAEHVDTSSSWRGTEFEVPATDTYEIHGETTFGEAGQVRLREVGTPSGD